MTIADVEWIEYDRRRDKTHGKPRHTLVCRIVTDEGAEGVCDLPMWHRDRCAQPERQRITAALLGRDPLEREAIWDDLYGAGLSLPLISYADVALWDLYGRVEGKPVHTLLGTKRDRIAVYKSTPFNVGPPEAYAEDALRTQEQGYRGYKIHPYRDWHGPNDAEKDIPVYRAVREAIGPDWPLMCDNYWSYDDYDEALRVGRILEELDYAWYESPMPENDDWLERYVRLCDELDILVCAPETAEGAHEVRVRWIEAGATDMGRLDVFYGGFTSCWQVAQECERRGIPMDLHCALWPHLQVFGATTDATIPYMEGYGDAMDYALDGDGCVAIPQAGGMGYDLDWDFIRASELE
jgi:L-alanine-DL-glutamate epimerase-like enolase superfamily enzyme